MTEIAIREPAATLAVANDVDSWVGVASQVIKLANEIADTPFVPDGLRGNVPAVSAAILAGRELGLPPLTSLANIHVIKGKPALSAVLMRALIQAQGHLWQDVEVSDTRVTVRAKRRGESEWTEASFSAAQAAKARIDLGGYAQDKLYARATSRLARRKFADVIAGMPYSAEELEDEPGDVAAIEAPKPGGRVTAAEITARASAPQAASPATPAPRAPETQPSPPAEPVAGEAPDEDRRVPLATGGQVGIIQSHFKRLGYSDDDRNARLRVTAKLAGLDDLGTTRELDQGQAARVVEHLSRCKDSGALDALLSDGERPDA